jgi:HAMP domain-containing protein
MKRTVFFSVLGTVLLAGLFYLGGFWLAVGLATLATTVIIFAAFALGSWWTAKTMVAGAQIAIRSAGQNDAHDAMKIKALAALAQETMKVRNQPSPATGYPLLPPFNAVDGTFTIAGLESEDVEQ